MLHKRVHADLERTLGLRESPQLLGVTRWPRAIPQPDGDHPRRMAGIRQQLAELPGLELAGAYRGGVAVADALASGVRGRAAARGVALSRSSITLHCVLGCFNASKAAGRPREIDRVRHHRHARNPLGGEHVERELEVLLAIADDEAQRDLLHDREHGEERVGLHADAHRR